VTITREAFESSQKDIICVYQLLALERGLDCLSDLEYNPMLRAKHNTATSSEYQSVASFYHHAAASRRRREAVERNSKHVPAHDPLSEPSPMRPGKSSWKETGRRQPGRCLSLFLISSISALRQETIPTRRCDNLGAPARVYSDPRHCFYRRPGSDPGRAAAGRPGENRDNV
jgi:hypothetical protein